MTDLPRVLAVTSEPPWPLNSGGHIRTFYMLRALSRVANLRVVCPATSGDSVAPLVERGVATEAVPVGGRSRLGEARRLAGAVTRGEPYVMYRRHAWQPMCDRILKEVQEFRPNALYLDHLDSLLYRRLAPSIPAVIDLHNVYSLLAARTADEQSSSLKRWFLRREARLLDRMERRAARECEGLLAVSSQEVEHFRSLGAANVHLAPNGVDCQALVDLPTGRDSSPPVVLFLGTMSWGPNAAAARSLAAETMPELRSRFPDARLLIVGRDPPAQLRALSGAGGVEVTGGVPDVQPYLRQASVLAVPLDAGGGTRLKVLEAFAAGLPVVSTAVGAEGIDATPGRHIVITGRPGFARAIIELAERPQAAREMADAARLLARERYDWGEIGARAARVVLQLATRTT